jgi:ubiquinone/menaquinone biosynthesis C-methylase UbiE
MKNDAIGIKKYWESRAEADSSIQSTTMDIWLRDIETSVVVNALKEKEFTSVCDVGCGDGATTIKCAETYPSISFTGFDYAENMIKNAQSNADKSSVKNIKFEVKDLTKNTQFNEYEFVYSTRCLINLANWQSQKNAINNIRDILKPGGFYLMIENFVEGHDQFNSIRKKFSLPEIPIREHNTFFHRDDLLDYLKNDFYIISEENISSVYYLVSRVIYSAICKQENIIPDYNDIHHQLASKLPFMGECGPLKAVYLQKK